MSLGHKEMKKFKLYWLDGTTEKVKGMDVPEALNRAGCDLRALKVLDHWEEVATDNELNQLTWMI